MSSTRQSQRGKPAEQGGYLRRDKIIADAAKIRAEAAASQAASEALHEKVTPMELRRRDRRNGMQL